MIPILEISGAIISSQGWQDCLDMEHDSHFYFTLQTRDDELYMEMESFGVSWLQAIQELVYFSQIP